MRILSAVWFYLKLSLVNLWFICWFVFYQYLSTRVFLISLCAAGFSILLILFQVFTWKTAVFSTENSSIIKQPISERKVGNFTETLFSPTQVVKRQIKLETLQREQPTHRDVLLNLMLLHTTEGNFNIAKNLSVQLQQIDPNHPLVIELSK